MFLTTVSVISALTNRLWRVSAHALVGCFRVFSERQRSVLGCLVCAV